MLLHTADGTMGEYIKIRAKAKQSLPKALVIENSKTILHGYVSIYKKIKKQLQKFGYSVQAKVMDTQRHGIKQRRERTYIVAIKKIHGRKFKFPPDLEASMPLKKVLHSKKKKVASMPCNSNVNKANMKAVHPSIDSGTRLWKSV